MSTIVFEPQPGTGNRETNQMEAAVRIIGRLLTNFGRPVALRLWNGITHHFGGKTPVFTLVVNDPGVLKKLVLRPNPLVLADAYFHGLLDCEGDLYVALQLKGQLQALSLGWRDRAALLFDAMRLPNRQRQASQGNASDDISFPHHHSKESDREAISFHYDVSNEFYKLWLDENMVYSCAYFEAENDSLEQAQRNKLDHICRKLRLKPGERLLDIGCGWGALVCWAARHHGVQAHGITLSQQQYEFAQQRILKEGLQDQVTVELRDYRDLEGDAVYDKVSSVGMFEHVGLDNLALYNETVHRVLRPNGLFLNHGITHDEEGWQKNVDTEFINRYVFPGGELDTVSNIQRGLERSGFEIHDVEGLRSHYALTLRQWVKRLEAGRDEALQHVSETTYRIWRFYMAACALEFEAGGTGIYQILTSRRGAAYAASPVPLSRRDLYDVERPASMLELRDRFTERRKNVRFG